MNKPSWGDAPEWANWLAKDANGSWWRYENEPLRVSKGFVPTGGRIAKVFSLDDQALGADKNWENSLEQRP